MDLKRISLMLEWVIIILRSIYMLAAMSSAMSITLVSDSFSRIFYAIGQHGIAKGTGSCNYLGTGGNSFIGSFISSLL